MSGTSALGRNSICYPADMLTRLFEGSPNWQPVFVALVPTLVIAAFVLASSVLFLLIDPATPLLEARPGATQEAG